MSDLNLAAKIKPLILGRGQSGQAVAKAVGLLQVAHPELGLLMPQFLPRDTDLATLHSAEAQPFLIICNPHALHADTVLRAVKSGFTKVVVEKPAAVSMEQVDQLRALTVPVGVLHGYRALWGPRFLREIVASGKIGSVVSVDGHYLQSSGVRTQDPSKVVGSWKTEAALRGPYDVYLDLGTHWADLVQFVLSEKIQKVQVRGRPRSTGTVPIDNHVDLSLGLHSGVWSRALISKIAHGYNNELEIRVFGQKGSLRWRFQDPDRVFWGAGSDLRVIVRSGVEPATGAKAFHGVGWLEGYASVLWGYLAGVGGDYPTLSENLDLLEKMFEGQSAQ
jgi:predicted dehydrogenase